MQKFFGCGCPGNKLDLGSNCGEWNGEIMLDRPNGDGLGFIKRIVPAIDTKTPHLVGVDWGVI